LLSTAEIIAYAKEVIGFSEVGELNTKALVFMPEVRDMCAANRCKAYGRTWTCPPACGTLEEITEKAKQYQNGIIVQSVGQMEDDFDVETMMETEQTQKEKFYELVAYLRGQGIDILPMACGACTTCKKCSYPDEPCRFPDKAIPSMEAYGIFVSKLCSDSGMKYNHGKNTIAFISCVLF